MKLQVLFQASYHLKIIILRESIIKKLVLLFFAPLDPNKKDEKVIFSFIGTEFWILKSLVLELMAFSDSGPKKVN